jgi:hypothetical protein
LLTVINGAFVRWACIPSRSLLLAFGAWLTLVWLVVCVRVRADILDFSKIESGKLELEDRPFELHRCIEEVSQQPNPTPQMFLLAPSQTLDCLFLSCRLWI